MYMQASKNSSSIERVALCCTPSSFSHAPPSSGPSAPSPRASPPSPTAFRLSSYIVTDGGTDIQCLVFRNSHCLLPRCSLAESQLLAVSTASLCAARLPWSCGTVSSHDQGTCVRLPWLAESLGKGMQRKHCTEGSSNSTSQC